MRPRLSILAHTAMVLALGGGCIAGVSAQTPYPHEPAGFQRFAEFDWSRLPQFFPAQRDGIAGRWFNFRGDGRRGGNGPMRRGQPGRRPGNDSLRTEGGRQDRPDDDSLSSDRSDEGARPDGGQAGEQRQQGLLQLREDPDAPQSPPGVVAMVYPRGFPGGSGPVNWGGWDESGAEKRSVYMSLWIKLDGADYENHAVGTKIGFFGVGLPPNLPGQSGNQVVLFIKGTGRQAVASSFRVELHQFFPKPAGAPWVAHFVGQNADQRMLMTAGRWHHWEVVMTVNDPGVPNGQIRWWIDNTLVMEYHDILYRPARGTHGFWNFKCNPTWGGNGGRRTRRDAILLDHIYLSGVPYDRPDGATPERN